MPFNDDNGCALEMLKLGYGDMKSPYHKRNLNFRVEFDLIDDICEAINYIGEYNDFNPHKVIVSIREAYELMGRFCSISIGREGSPVIYLRTFGENNDNILDVMTQAKPDELNIKDDGSIRAWWD